MLVSGKSFAISVICAIALSLSIGLLVHFAVKFESPNEYQSLDQIKHYAQKLPEFPLSDDNDWLDPSYKTFITTRVPTISTHLARQFGVDRQDPWSPRYLADLLKALTKQNHDFGLIDGKNSFIHIKSNKNTTIYVFGDLHGAFHSLIRDIDFLHNKGLIDENLRIINDNTYLVFNGDAINRSPYSVDTLILLATLMQKNPRNVFYVAGKHERDSTWADFGLRRELVERGRSLSVQQIPFQDIIDKFFSTLPEAIYVSFANSGPEVLRIAFSARKNLHFEETSLSTSFVKDTERVRAHVYMRRAAHEPALDTRIAFKTEEWRVSNRIIKGFGLLDQDQGATTWAVFSSPTTVHRVYMHFNYDAFSCLNLNQKVNEATVSRIYNDTRTHSGFIVDPDINLISAKQERVSNSDVIKVASTMALVRGVPTMGQQAQRGLDLSFNRFNQSAKNARHLIRLYVDNDDYVPQIARGNVMHYLEQKIPFLILPTGTPTTMSYINSIKNENFLVMFPITGALGLRNSKYKNIVHFRASYQDEIRALIKELRSEYDSSRFAFFYQDDSYGRDPLTTALHELKKIGVTEILTLPYTRGGINFEGQINELKKYQPDALGFFATATAVEELVRQMGPDFLTNTKLFAISFVAEMTLRRYAKKHGLEFLFGAVVPNPKTATMPIARRYRQIMDENNLTYDVFSFEAFIASNIFIDMIEKLGDREVSPRTILKKFESIKNYDFEGIRLNFDRASRSLAQQVWLETGEESEWKEYHIKPITRRHTLQAQDH